VYVALKFDSQFMFTSPKFSKFISLVQAKNLKIARFFQSKVSKEIWNVHTKYFIGKAIRKELDLITNVLASPDKYT